MRVVSFDWVNQIAMDKCHITTRIHNYLNFLASTCPWNMKSFYIQRLFFFQRYPIVCQKGHKISPYFVCFLLTRQWQISCLLLLCSFHVLHSEFRNSCLFTLLVLQFFDLIAWYCFQVKRELSLIYRRRYFYEHRSCCLQALLSLLPA